MLQSYNLIPTLPKNKRKKRCRVITTQHLRNTKTMCLILTTITNLNIVQILYTITNCFPCKQGSDRKVGSYRSHPVG